MLFRFPYIVLLIIAVAAFSIRAYNLFYNSTFVDEAFYVVIGQQILNGEFSKVAGAISWVGAFPFFYPFFSGLFYSLGGIVATRLFNVELGTISVILMFVFARSLKLFPDKFANNVTGLVAAAIMATAAVPIQLSRLAIYDMLSFTIFLLGLIFYVWALQKKDRWFYLAAAITIFLAFLAKYIVLIYIPLFIVSGWFMDEKSRKNFTFYFSIPLFLMTALYGIINLPKLIEYFSSQVGDPTTTYSDVISVFWQFSLPLTLFAGISALLLWKSKKETIKALLFMGLFPVFVHTVTKNNTSSEQHVFLVLTFLLPLVGAFFAYIFTKNKLLGILVTSVFVLLNLAYSYPIVRDAESFWPDSTEAAEVIKNNVAGDDIILAEGSDTIYLGLGGAIPISQVIGPFVFDYQGLEGRDAYLKAIDDRYFKLVEIEKVYFSTQDIQAIEAKLAENYTIIFDDGKIRVYSRN